MRKLPNSWRPEEDAYLMEHYRATPYYQIAERLGRTRSAVSARAFKLELKRTPEEQGHIARTYNRNCFQKGHTSWNKGMKGLQIGGIETQFKKGGTPPNTKHDGAISIRKDKRGTPYKFIRIGPKKWAYLQRHLWQEKHGPIPDGMILRCIDGDTLNCEPENWHLMDRKKHMGHNSGPLHLSQTYVAATMTVRQPELRKELMKHPEIIELQRCNMLLKREIKKQLLND
jgi:hypothetical protein